MKAPEPDNGAPHQQPDQSRNQLLLLSLAAMGVVYGDIGTSPLYALRECFHGSHPLAPSPENVLGILSLVFWALTLVISIKYLLFMMRADNRGEGGILASSSRPVAFLRSRNAACSPSACSGRPCSTATG